MEIEHERMPDGGAHCVRLAGKLDVFSFVELKTFLERLSDSEKGAKVVVDLARADYVASSGWSVLMGRRKLMRLGGGDLVVCGIRPEVRRVYDSMKVGKLLPSAEDLDGALRLLASPAPEGDHA